MSHGNERWFQDTEVAVKNDGTLLGFRTKALDDAGAWLRYEPLGGVIWAQVAPGHVPLAQHPARVHAGRDEQGARLAEPRLLAHAAAVVHRARDRHRRARARARPGRGAQAQLHPRRGHAVRDAERLRLRLGRLRGHARHRARADRLGRHRRAPPRRREPRQAARRRHRLDARLGHEQLRPVADDQPRAAVLGQQRGRDGEARHLRRDRRHPRHDAAGAGARDDGGAGRRRHPQVRRRLGARPRRPRQLLELARRLLRHVREPVRRHGPERRQGRHRHARGRDQEARVGHLRRRPRGGARAGRRLRPDQGEPRRGAAVHGVRRDHQREQRRACPRISASRSTAATSTGRRSRCPTSSGSSAT